MSKHIIDFAQQWLAVHVDLSQLHEACARLKHVTLIQTCPFKPQKRERESTVLLVFSCELRAGL